MSILHRESRGNLHLRLAGEFNENSARELLEFLDLSTGDAVRVFLDTVGLETILPGGVETFRTGLDLDRFPADRLFFKGEDGRRLAPPGYRVLITPENVRCSGCSGCPGKSRQDLFSLHRIAS